MSARGGIPPQRSRTLMPFMTGISTSSNKTSCRLGVLENPGSAASTAPSAAQKIPSARNALAVGEFQIHFATAGRSGLFHVEPLAGRGLDTNVSPAGHGVVSAMPADSS